MYNNLYHVFNHLRSNLCKLIHLSIYIHLDHLEDHLTIIPYINNFNLHGLIFPDPMLHCYVLHPHNNNFYWKYIDLSHLLHHLLWFLDNNFHLLRILNHNHEVVNLSNYLDISFRWLQLYSLIFSDHFLLIFYYF